MESLQASVFTRHVFNRMLSTLILIFSVPDALQARGPALSSLKPAELTAATSEPQPPRVNSVALLPLHPASAYTAAPVLTEAAVPQPASTNSTAITSQPKRTPAKGAWKWVMKPVSNSTSKQKGGWKWVRPAELTAATSQSQPKRVRDSSTTTGKPKQRLAKAGAARPARVHGSYRLPAWLVGAFLLGLLVPVGLAVRQDQDRRRQGVSPK